MCVCVCVRCVCAVCVCVGGGHTARGSVGPRLDSYQYPPRPNSFQLPQTNIGRKGKEKEHEGEGGGQ